MTPQPEKVYLLAVTERELQVLERSVTWGRYRWPLDPRGRRATAVGLIEKLKRKLDYLAFCRDAKPGHDAVDVSVARRPAA